MKQLLMITLMLLATPFITSTNREIAAVKQEKIVVKHKKVILVIDTGVTLKISKKEYMCTHIKSALSIVRYESGILSSASRALHGSNIVGLIGNRINTKKYCIVSIRTFTDYDSSIMNNYLRSLALAKSIPDIVAVNLSIQTDGLPEVEQYSKKEHEAIQLLLNSGVKVVVAAGNGNRLLSKKTCTSYPACLKMRVKNAHNFYVVGSAKTPCKSKYCEKEKALSSNWSKYMPMSFENGMNAGSPKMSGTSQATAIKTGRLFSK